MHEFIDPLLYSVLVLKAGFTPHVLCLERVNAPIAFGLNCVTYFFLTQSVDVFFVFVFLVYS